MPSFLTNSRMHPALVRRIEASLHGKTGGRSIPARKNPIWKSLRRLTLLTVVALAATLVVLEYGEQRAHFEAERDALSSLISETRAQLTEQDRKLVERVRPWLEAAARDFGGDHADPELRDPEALGALLARPTVYVRGPVEAFGEHDAMVRAAAESQLDPFSYCLLNPPETRVEKVVARQVDLARGGGTPFRESVEQLFRLHDAILALHYLQPAWSQAIERAERLGDVQRLRQDWERADVERKLAAARSQVLIYLLDEPKTPGTIVELDGASDHWVRVGIVDLVAARAVFQARRHLDPSWISESRRVRFASGIDGCRLAYDLRAELRGDAELGSGAKQ